MLIPRPRLRQIDDHSCRETHSADIALYAVSGNSKHSREQGQTRDVLTSISGQETTARASSEIPCDRHDRDRAPSAGTEQNCADLISHVAAARHTPPAFATACGSKVGHVSFFAPTARKERCRGGLGCFVPEGTQDENVKSRSSGCGSGGLHRSPKTGTSGIALLLTRKSSTLLHANSDTYYRAGADVAAARHTPPASATACGSKVGACFERDCLRQQGRRAAPSTPRLVLSGRKWRKRDSSAHKRGLRMTAIVHSGRRFSASKNYGPRKIRGPQCVRRLPIS
jgi:hypothetical protein